MKFVRNKSNRSRGRGKAEGDSKANGGEGGGGISKPVNHPFPFDLLPTFHTNFIDVH